jgi:hypothetical protein
VIAEDDSWHIQLISEAIHKVDQGRAVLVICQTEEDLLTIKNDLEIIQASKSDCMPRKLEKKSKLVT